MQTAFAVLPLAGVAAWEAAYKDIASKQTKKDAVVTAALAGPALDAVSAAFGSVAASFAPMGEEAPGGASPALALPSDAQHNLNRTLRELFAHVVAGTVSPPAAIKLLVDAKPPLVSLGPAGASAFADVAWLVGIELEEADVDEEGDWRKEPGFAPYRAFLTGAVAASLVPDTLLKERLELDVLEACGLIKSSATFRKSVVRTQTKMRYQQHKYNLAHEEPEGFAKLITEFLRPLTSETVPSVAKNMRMLIGYFRLDPNRVFDLLLEAFEMNPNNAHYLTLIDLFPSAHLPHILGFKLQQYAAPGADVTPRSLLYTVASLLTAGRVSVEAMAPHLSPPLSELKTAWEKVTASFVTETKALSVVVIGAAAVPTDESSAMIGTATGYAASELVKEAWKGNQWLGMLECLCALRAWDCVANVFTWLREAGVGDVGIHVPVWRTLCAALTDITAGPYAVISRAHTLATEIAADTGAAAPAPVIPVRKPCPFLPVPEDVDVETPSLASVPALIRPALSVLGIHVSNDLRLYVRLCRLMASILSATAEPGAAVEASEDGLSYLSPTQVDALGIVRDYLLPALPFMGPNVGVVSELWLAIQGLSWKVRYALYAAWSTVPKQVPLVALVYAKTVQETKQAMKRVAGETASLTSRKLARLAHSNPMALFDAMYMQLKVYDNLIPIAVDALRFMTGLSFDVATYVLLSHLNPYPAFPKVQSDNITPAPWYSAMGAMVGKLYKRFPLLELRGLLNSLVTGLLKGSSFDLYLLQELLVGMGGCAPTAELSDHQLQRLAGGPVLQYICLQMSASASKKPVRRLRDMLLAGTGSGALITPLFLLICKQFNVVLSHANGPLGTPTPLKVMGGKFDLVLETLSMFVDFVHSNVSYSQLLPSLPTFSELVNTHSLSPKLAFALARPAIREVISTVVDGAKRAQGTEAAELEAGLVSWDFRGELAAQVTSCLSPAVWESITPTFYLLFWGLTLSDIHAPKEQYAKQVEELRAEIASLEANIRSVDESSPDMANQRKELDRKSRANEESIKKLEEEQPLHAEHVKKMREYLISVKGSLFGTVPNHADTVQTILQHCVLPRVTLTPADALYTAKFFLTLHSLGTPFFSTIVYVDKVLRQLTPTVLCSSRREATCLGVFMLETLTTFQRWYDSKSVYEKECMSKVGFSRQIRGEVVDTASQIAYDHFVKVHKKIQERITKIFLLSLSSGEYMELNNSFVVLRRISSVFPMLQGHARALLGKLQNIRDTTDREDLKVSATTFAGQLERRIPSLTPGGVIAGEPAAAEPEEAAPKKGKGKGDGEAVAKKVKEAGTPKDAGVDVSEEKPAKASKGDKAAKSEAAPAPVKVRDGIPKELMSLKSPEKEKAPKVKAESSVAAPAPAPAPVPEPAPLKPAESDASVSKASKRSDGERVKDVGGKRPRVEPEALPAPPARPSSGRDDSKRVEREDDRPPARQGAPPVAEGGRERRGSDADPRRSAPPPAERERSRDPRDREDWGRDRDREPEPAAPRPVIRLASNGGGARPFTVMPPPQGGGGGGGGGREQHGDRRPLKR